MPRLVYERIYWEDAPSINTPLSAENLNNMDNGLASLYADVGDLEGNLDTLITSDLVPTEAYDETEQGYIATHNYAIGDTMILSSPNETKNCRAFEAISIGAEIVSVTQQEYADLENMLFAGSTPNVVEIPQGDAVVEAISKYVEIDQNVVRNSNIANNLLTTEEGFVLDARQANVLANSIATIETIDDPSDNPVASKDYVIDEIFILDNKLYKAVEAINAGAELVDGSNIIETSIEEELASRPRIETGIKDVTFTSGSTYADHTINFSKPFVNTPKIFTMVRTRTDIQTNVPVFALDIVSTSQFTIRVWKQVGAGTSGMAPQIHWMAVGI